jgi:phosphoheptose isomerase
MPDTKKPITASNSDSLDRIAFGPPPLLEGEDSKAYDELLAGVSGGAGDARHIAGEFPSRFNYDRAPLSAIALTTSSSVLAAVGNDYGYNYVFERIRGLARPNDAFIAISPTGSAH